MKKICAILLAAVMLVSLTPPEKSQGWNPERPLPM